MGGTAYLGASPRGATPVTHSALVFCGSLLRPWFPGQWRDGIRGHAATVAGRVRPQNAYHLGYTFRVPTVWDEGGIRIVVHTLDHQPAHVHCYVAGREVIVLLEPEVRVRSQTRGLTAGEVRRVLALVRANQGSLTKQWRRLHP